MRNFYKKDGIAQKLARSDMFERITLGVICNLTDLDKIVLVAATEIRNRYNIGTVISEADSELFC